MTHFKWHFNKEQKENKIERVAYFHWHGRYQELSRFRPWSQNSREYVLSRFLFGLCLIFVKSLHITPEKYKTKSWWIIITKQNIAEIIFLYMETHKKRSCFISRQGTNIKTDHLALQTLGICQIMKQQKSENKQGFVDRQRLHRDSTVRSPSLTCSCTVLVL